MVAAALWSMADMCLSSAVTSSTVFIKMADFSGNVQLRSKFRCGPLSNMKETNEFLL